MHKFRKKILTRIPGGIFSGFPVDFLRKIPKEMPRRISGYISRGIFERIREGVSGEICYEIWRRVLQKKIRKGLLNYQEALYLIFKDFSGLISNVKL